VTAATIEVSPVLLQQLKPSGQIDLPLGSTGIPQKLTVGRKNINKALLWRSVLPIQFVPMRRQSQL
jgi:protein-L-isoaspartate O-methyltransferase